MAFKDTKTISVLKVPFLSAVSEGDLRVITLIEVLMRVEIMDSAFRGKNKTTKTQKKP